MSLLRQVISGATLRVRSLEDWWFDWTRHVKTGGDPVPHRATDTLGPARDGHVYGPARAHNVRSAIKALPLSNPADYTFIDLGSGKGRVLFLAAETPFRGVVGVEYSAAMHKQAVTNLHALRRRPRAKIDLLHADAATFEFPPGNLVIYMFNPFGPEVMSCVLRNLERAIRDLPRHVVVVMLYPELGSMVAASPELRPFAHTRRFEIYEGGQRPAQAQHTA